MESIVLFDTEEELQQLTGLDHNALWNAGFNLDDWDWGIQIGRPLTVTRTKTVHYQAYDYPITTVTENGSHREWVHRSAHDEEEKYEEEMDDLPYWASRLIEHWQDYCVGGSHAEYNGKHYYMWHHS